MNSSPERDARLTYEQIESALSQLFANYKMLVIVFAGGEPTLLGKDLYKAISYCRANKVVSRIVTNAYWAHSIEAARQKCAELKEAGLDELNISMDDYHEPYVPFERVKLAHQAAVEAGFRAVVIANACGPQSALSPAFLEKEFHMGDVPMARRFDVDGHSNHQERKSCNDQIFVLSNGNVQRLGRGIDLIADEEIITDLNSVPEGLGGCPHAVRSAAISPRNHMLSCCGFELHGNPILDFGDLNKETVKETLDKADDDLIVNMIALIGPPNIKKFLQKLCPDDVSFPRRRYQSYCEVCQDLVTIEKNRRAMYQHQGELANIILNAREMLEKRRDPKTGRVPIDISVRIDDLELVHIASEEEAGKPTFPCP
jgi:hypothetical protein